MGECDESLRRWFGFALASEARREHPGLKRETWATHLAEYPVPMEGVDGGSEESRMDDLLLLLRPALAV
jgi:hypothetical protein